MSKKYKNKTCVYCVTPNSSEEGDHVISRSFFLLDKRSNLPQVPACKACNNAKSELEHYLSAVMPFAARHADSAINLDSMVPPRLAKNKKLHIALADGTDKFLTSRNGEPWSVDMTIPFDSKRLTLLFEYIAKGLAYYHWQIYLPPDHLVNAMFLTGETRAKFEGFIAHAKKRVQADLGDGVFIYEGIKAEECSELTVWRMSLYGAQVTGDPRAPTERCSVAYVLTAPKRMSAAVKLVKALNIT